MTVSDSVTWGRVVRDKLVILPPGVDAHVHLAMDAGAVRTCDDFGSGSLAALRGGTAALVDFVETLPGQPLLAALAERRRVAADAAVPVKFHMTISEWRDSMPDEMRACHAAGVRSFKIYLAYLETIGIDDVTVRKVLTVAHSLGAKVLAHAEDGQDIAARQAACVARAELAPRYHALSRPPECEVAAIARLVAMVEEIGGPQLVIAHVSSAAAMQVIQAAKSRGLPVFAETCPQYLMLTAGRYDLPNDTAAPYVLSPPLRSAADVEYLWSAVADGTVDFIATDHCPFLLKDKLAHADNFMRIPNGAGGIAERMALVLGEGHVRRGIPLQRLVDVLSLNAGRFHDFRLPDWPASGQASGGAAASQPAGQASGGAAASQPAGQASGGLAASQPVGQASGGAVASQPAGQASGKLPSSYSLWELGCSYTWRHGLGGSAGDHSIYEGMEFRAMPRQVVLDGITVARDWHPATA